MREIHLINELEYNHQYMEINQNDGKKIYDGGNLIYDTVKLSKTVYKADELVSVCEDNIIHVNNITNSFIETFRYRGGATKEQINFAEETSKIIYGDLKEDIITVIPAPCGFGKSSITLEILKEQIKLYKSNTSTDGIIIVTDRLESLRETEKALKELDLDGYSFVLEGWNEDLCNNKKMKQSENKACTPNKCPYFFDCKIYTQQQEQNKYPILLITNARLRVCGESIKSYNTYEKGNRTILLIDERPDVMDTIKVNKSLLNEISTEISKCTYESKSEKTVFENKWKYISNTIENKMQRLREKHKRFIISNINNEIICKNDTEFMELWDKYMENKYIRELGHIHTVLKMGGFYVYEKDTEFICTIGSKDLRNMYSDTFKTIIFDGTALYDPLYLGMYKKESIKFLDIENTRLYSNLNIKAHTAHKLTKTTFKDKTYLARACAKFVEDRMKIGFLNKGYVVSHQTQSVNLGKYINDTRIAKLSDNECHYFGNTKGKNGMQDCDIMFQFGWDTMPDYDYVIQWLSVCVDWENTINHCSNVEKAEKLSDELIIKDRSVGKFNNCTYSSQYKSYEFGLQSLNQFKMFSIVTNFYQEVHRTKLRNYNCTEEKIEVNVFAQKHIILKMIEQLFPKCNMKFINDKLSCFKESKIEGRESKEGYTIPQRILNWINNAWNGKEIKTRDMLKEINITQKQFDKAKENNSELRNILNKYSYKRGIYKKAS